MPGRGTGVAGAKALRQAELKVAAEAQRGQRGQGVAGPQHGACEAKAKLPEVALGVSKQVALPGPGTQEVLDEPADGVRQAPQP